jgi:hypothetical protein
MALLLLDQTDDGSTLDVMIGLPQDRMMALQRRGSPIPPPLRVRGLIDNGTNITGVAKRIMSNFRLRKLRTSSTTTIAGSLQAELYQVSLSLSTTLGSPPSMLIRPSLVIIALTTLLPNNIEVLIGRDVLDECLFVGDGPRRQFCLSW